MNLTKAFNYINKELFNGYLDKPELHYINNKQAKKVFNYPIDGICIASHATGDIHYTIGIQKSLTKNEKFNTLVHELIHVFLMETKGYAGHGKPFKEWCFKAIDTFYGTFEDI